MRILVYGVGVLGSYLAHELYCGEHDVTVLARGKRYEYLKKNGLTIEHIRQKSNSIDLVNVTNRLDPKDVYDIIFVVMQKSQLANVLPILAENTECKMIVFMGNNTEADRTYHEFMMNSRSKSQVLFGFMSCGGYRKEEKVYNWHGNRCDITIGSIKEVQYDDDMLQHLFSATNLIMNRKSDMDSWLKFHSALITPICMAIQYEGGNAKNLRKSKALRIAVDAVKELISMFEKEGYINDAPDYMKVLGWSTNILQTIFGFILSTKTGNVVAISHALNAVDEIEMLKVELQTCAQKYHTRLPYFEELCKMVK